MELENRLGIISKIVKDNYEAGKTALMKFVYILQHVYKVPLGYEFSIYTYGPYSSEVMGDIDYANANDVIRIHRDNYSSGMVRYSISCGDNAKKYLDHASEIIHRYQSSIQEMLSFFGKKSAKELELLATIIYIYFNFQTNGWDMSEVTVNVHEIKPYFSMETIQSEYDRLSELGIFEKAAA